jgi:O-antigen ligase
MRAGRFVLASEGIASWILFAAAALAPLPLGSNEPPAVAFWCVVLGLCLVLAPAPDLGPGQLAVLGLAAVVIAAYALVLHEQVADHPWFATARPIWQAAQAALGRPLQPSVSIARHQPWFDLGRPLVCMLAAACGFFIGAERRRALQLIRVLAWSGAVCAAYGIAAHLLDPASILWRDKTAYFDSVTATFINRNTAAVYFGCCAVAWSLFLFDRINRDLRRPITWRTLVRHFLGEGLSRGVIVKAAMLLLCLTAMFMTRSRAGVVLSLAILVVDFLLYFRREFSGRAGTMVAVACGCALALLLLQFMGGLVNARFQAQGFADEGRIAAWSSTLRMIADHPWLGTGQGTFAWGFPAYRSSEISMQGVWDHAHNTLLELAAEVGIPLAVLVALLWVVILVLLVRGVRVRRRYLLVPACALSVALVSVLHSLVDFSLQVPGFAIPALAVVGAGLSQSLSGPRTKAQADEVAAASRHGKRSRLWVDAAAD